MRIFQRLELLAVLLGLAVPVVAKDMPTVAVVDIISTNGSVDGVMLGAADLLEAELSRYDVRVISRRELNLLRGERGLARGGVVRIEDFQGGALPWADFLLRGEYQFGAGESGVRFRLVDARTGTERGSWQLLVERPADLVKNLDPILPRIAAAVCGEGVAAPRPRNQPGFTTIPEAASTFYHGLDHMVSGRPEYAAEYFRIAAASDTNFALAVLAQAKAFEQLGFPGVAEAVRATIPAGQLPQAQAAGTSSVLTVRFVDRSDAFTAGQMQRIRDALQETHGFALFEPDWIPALTRETDLKLSEDFPLVHGLDHRLWLRADQVIVFSAEKKGLRASVIDLLHGQLLGTVTGGSTNLDGLCAEAVAIIRQPGAVVAELPLARTSNTNGPEAKLNFTYSVAEVAFALRHLADRPKDLACWVHLLCVIQPERLPPDVFRAFLDAHEAALPADAPDADVWLASVLWARYGLALQQAGDPPDIESHFAPLLHRYPDGLQAQIVRFHLARFLSAGGERDRSRKLAVELAEKLAAKVLSMDSFIPLRGEYLDCIQRIDDSAFPNAIPPEGPRMKMLARDLFALAAYLSALADDLTNAQKFLSQAEPLMMLTIWGAPRSHHFGGPISLYPVNIGVWQTGHIGYSWKPADPADDGRVQVGWTFLPYAVPENKPTLAAAPSTYTMITTARERLAGAAAAAGPAGLKKGAAKPPEPWPYIKFDGFMNVGRKPPVPILNGQKVGVGGNISGAKVVAIDDRTVQLRYMGQTIALQPGQATGKPRDLDAEAVAEYMRQNPNLQAQIQARQQSASTAGIPLRNDPKTGASDSRPPREIWQEWLTLRSTDGDPYGGERAYATALSVFSYACAKEGKERGAAAAADFAVQILADYRAAGARLAAEFGEIRAGKLALRMYEGAAHYGMEAADPARAWALTQEALAWRGRDDLKFSLRYQAALTAWKGGHDDTAAEILRTLAEEPRAKDLPLILPFVTEPRRSVYLESVDLLEKVRAGSAPDLRPAAIDLTPVKPYYIGGIRPGTTKKEKPKRGLKPPTKEEEWAQIMAKWLEGAGPTPVFGADVTTENYEAWPEDEEHVPPPPPPPTGQPHVCALDDGVGIEFVWIESMHLWAAKYELTDNEWCYAMTETEVGGRLPKDLGYREAVAVCLALTKRAGKGLPEGYCYRIPTIEEWERLARCGTGRIYPWGDAMPPTFGNYSDETRADAERKSWGDKYGMYGSPVIAGYRDGYEGPAPVEESGKNEWGLYGVGGNLWDWSIKSDGKPMPKGAAWGMFADVALRVDAGFGGSPGGTALRIVLAPELKPATPAP